jgi:hypothetical protein
MTPKRTQRHFMWTMEGGAGSSYRPWRSTSLGGGEEGGDGAANPHATRSTCAPGGATTLISMVEGASAVSSSVMRSPMH